MPMMRHLRIKKGYDAGATYNVNDNETEDNSEQRNINNDKVIMKRMKVRSTRSTVRKLMTWQMKKCRKC